MVKKKEMKRAPNGEPVPHPYERKRGKYIDRGWEAKVTVSAKGEPQKQVRAHGKTQKETGFVFTDEFGEHLKSITVYNNFKRIAAQIGAPDARVHDLRHTFAVISLQNGDDFKTVQDALGHATAAFTLDVYGHVSERMREESARRQQAYIEALGI